MDTNSGAGGSGNIGNILDHCRDPRRRTLVKGSSKLQQCENGERLPEIVPRPTYAEKEKRQSQVSIESFPTVNKAPGDLRFNGPSRLLDVSHRLFNDALQEREYVKGHGVRVVKTVQPEFDEPGPRERPKDRTFHCE